jgi:hypothetical protein
MVGVFVVIALIGSILNAMMRIKLSYVFWLVSNVFLVAHNLRIGEHSQAFLFGAYLITSIIGLKNSIGDNGWFSKHGRGA